MPPLLLRCWRRAKFPPKCAPSNACQTQRGALRPATARESLEEKFLLVCESRESRRQGLRRDWSTPKESGCEAEDSTFADKRCHSLWFPPTRRACSLH